MSIRVTPRLNKSPVENVASFLVNREDRKTVGQGCQEKSGVFQKGGNQAKRRPKRAATSPDSVVSEGLAASTAVVRLLAPHARTRSFRQGRQRLLLGLLGKLVADHEGVRDQDLLPSLDPHLPGVPGLHGLLLPLEGRLPPPPLAIAGDAGVVAAVEVLVDTLDRLAAGHAGGDQGSELNHLGAGELEGVEVGHEVLDGDFAPGERAHDLSLGGAAVGVQQHDLVLVVTVLVSAV